jgi:predicted Rossmann-fold nucleotide-binding protein
MLTLAQTHKLDRRIPVILYGSQYWNEIVNFKALLRHGMISAEDLDLFECVDTPDAALRVLQTSLEPEPAEGTPAFAHSQCG